MATDDLELLRDWYRRLAYWNGSVWYDTHPLVEAVLEREAKRRS